MLSESALDAHIFVLEPAVEHAVDFRLAIIECHTSYYAVAAVL
jgi:hypothetical protein